MNEGFLKLPGERRKQIENAGFKVFALNEYKKAPMNEIAGEAGISKSLLFYHFKNKKELYRYLWDKSLSVISKEMQKQNIFETDDFFEMLRRSLIAKCSTMREYPYAMAFSMKAYFEKNKEVADDVHKSYNMKKDLCFELSFEKIDKTKLRSDIDFKDIYYEIMWAAEGYMNDAFRSSEMDVDKIERDFDKLIELWKKVYSAE